MKKCSDEKPHHRLLLEHGPHSHFACLRWHSLFQIGQAPNTGRDRRQTQHGPAWKMFHAKVFEPSTGQKYGDQKSQRAKEANTAITFGIKRATLTHQVGHGRFTHRHHGTGVGEHHQQHQTQSHRSKLKKQNACANQCHGGAVTQQLDALACVVTEPTPTVGRKQTRRGLHRSQDADGHQTKAQLLQPQRQVRIEKSNVRKVTGRNRGKRNQLTALGR